MAARGLRKWMDNGSEFVLAKLHQDSSAAAASWGQSHMGGNSKRYVAAQKTFDTLWGGGGFAGLIKWRFLSRTKCTYPGCDQQIGHVQETEDINKQFVWQICQAL